MASNTRGKLKEEFEGIHRNFDWVMHHCQKSLGLIKDKNPGMKVAVESLYEGVKTLDDITSKLYGTL